jgi:hypothetical protein
VRKEVEEQEEREKVRIVKTKRRKTREAQEEDPEEAQELKTRAGTKEAKKKTRTNNFRMFYRKFFKISSHQESPQKRD